MSTLAQLAVTAHVRSWLDRVRPGRTYESIAKELGVSHAQIIHIHQGIRNVGPKVEEAFARLHHGGSVDDLRRAAIDAYEREREKRAKYPNRDEAADVFRRDGRDPRAIDRVFSDPPPSADHSTLKWIHVLELVEMDIRREDVESQIAALPPPHTPRSKRRP